MLLEKTKYEHYIRYISGFLMLTCLIQPVIRLTDIQDRLDASWVVSALSGELKEMKNSGLPDMEDQLYENYGNVIKKQIINLGEEFGLKVEDVDLEFDRSEEKISEIRIRTGSNRSIEDMEQMAKYRKALSEYYHLEAEKIYLE